MAALREIFEDQAKRDRLIDDACELLDAEVSSKGGLSGMAIKTSYKLVKGVQPGFIRKAVGFLLDDFLGALDPIYQEALQRGLAPGRHLQSDPSRVANALLAITDARAERAKAELLRKTYQKLRPSAKQHVEAAVPRLGDLMDRHLPNTAAAAG